MSTTAYLATQAAACAKGRRRPAPGADLDPLTACADVARLLAAGPVVLPDVVALLGAAMGAPVLLSPSGTAAVPSSGSATMLEFPVAQGRLGVLRVQPEHPAWRDPASPAPVLLAQLLATAFPADPTSRSQDVAAALLDGFEHEKRRIAERLHRGVLQSLVGGRYLLDLARSSDASASAQAVGLASEAVQEALVEARAMLRDVTPRVAERASLEAEAAALPHLTVSRSGDLALAPVIAATAYRLLQALAALAGETDVHLTDRDGCVRLAAGPLTDRTGTADRAPGTTGDPGRTDSAARAVDVQVERLRMAGARIVDDGEHLVVDLPAAPRLPVQRDHRTARATAASSTTQRDDQQDRTDIRRRAIRRSEGNP